MRRQRLALLTQGYLDERLAIIATAVEEDTPAGRALADIQATLPDLFYLLDSAVEVVEQVLDRRAVAQEHTS